LFKKEILEILNDLRSKNFDNQEWPLKWAKAINLINCD
jgi:hypothetical protein